MEKIVETCEFLGDIKTLLPLQHGGHALVFKTTTNMVLKIVGLTMYKPFTQLRAFLVQISQCLRQRRSSGADEPLFLL